MTTAHIDTGQNSSSLDPSAVTTATKEAAIGIDTDEFTPGDAGT